MACDDLKRAQRICDKLSPDKIDALARKWFRKLPHPFTGKDRAAGFRYDVSILQAEFSLTQVLEKPVLGRQFFEHVIRENLDIGRPSQVQLIFERKVIKSTPGRFRTRIITNGVIPSLHVDYKRTRIKQYHKESQALRTETIINHTPDFGIGKRLKNLPSLREVGFSANRRLLDVQCVSHDCSLGETTFSEMNAPKQVNGQRVSALRFGDPLVQALMPVLCLFCSWLTNRNSELSTQSVCHDSAHVGCGTTSDDKHHGIMKAHGTAIASRLPGCVSPSHPSSQHLLRQPMLASGISRKAPSPLSWHSKVNRGTVLTDL